MRWPPHTRRLTQTTIAQPPLDTMYAPLDWVGFHYYTRRIVSDASKEQFLGGGKFSGTEIENNSPGGRDPYTRFSAAMPTEGPLTDAGLEVWPRGMYDLVTQISREYNHPIIEITESGCGYLGISMDPMKKKTAAYPTAVASSGT